LTSFEIIVVRKAGPAPQPEFRNGKEEYGKGAPPASPVSRSNSQGIAECKERVGGGSSAKRRLQPERRITHAVGGLGVDGVGMLALSNRLIMDAPPSYFSLLFK
jgi:hypothetical protein